VGRLYYAGVDVSANVAGKENKDNAEAQRARRGAEKTDSPLRAGWQASPRGEVRVVPAARG
jgi:hypothetical protein